MKIISNIIFLLFLNNQTTLASEVIKHDIKKPIEFSSSKLTINEQKKCAIFEENVKTIQGDLTIEADRMIINFQSRKGRWEIQDIIYNKNIKLSIADRKAFGDKAMLNFIDKVFTVEGNVRLVKRSNEIKGNKLIYDLSSGTLEIKGDASSRAKMTVNIP